ncbi:hypothetical protein D0B32_08855 [Paraburkholderia sp. DHOC27]|nr:hypothetical protein D0B32_08855 [Paraburkholderia sp. DHOC27]
MITLESNPLREAAHAPESRASLYLSISPYTSGFSGLTRHYGTRACSGRVAAARVFRLSHGPPRLLQRHPR